MTATISPGSMFITRIFMKPSRLTPIPISMRPPVALIYVTAASDMKGCIQPAARVNVPW